MKTVALFSGGLDSTLLLYELLQEGDEVLALSIDYGQRHRIELEYAQRIASLLNVQWEVADLSGITHLIAGSSQTSEEVAVPHGHYAEESMKQTVVPNRNMIMLSVAAGWAINQKANRVAYAAHGGDHTIYPDCRPEFAKALDKTLQLADWHSVTLYSPFISLSKTELVQRGNLLNVDFSLTWSCYEGGKKHCGKCGTCVERKEAFKDAAVNDPTLYSA
ncbi:7-cyano-7-deazaguanine synthase [hydrothermal vent metagenome]|uniref:7-cyano-7-deazaguanine synthase n=1 Tax=hydrothermal vent metagenome TaxID=652676 RepID=A0A3B1DUE0_9ZZZZ